MVLRGENTKQIKISPDKKEELLKLDAKKIELLSNAYHATNVAKFESLLRRMQK